MRLNYRFGILVTLSACALNASEAPAQDTIALYGDTGMGLSRTLMTTSGLETFDIVAVADPSIEYAWIEFRITEDVIRRPGVFKVGVQYHGTHPVIDSQPEFGDYAFIPNWGGCAASGQAEMVRVTFLDLDDVLGQNIVVGVTPLLPDGPSGVNCREGPCYSDCWYTEHFLAPAPWTDFDVIDPTWIPGVESSDGVLVLNPDAIAVDGTVSSMGTLKARY